MVYTELTGKAMKIAYAAHHGQVDKAGIPYIFHPIHLAEQMEDEISCCVALLHDVVEDTDITLEALAPDFPREVIAALKLLTHKADTDYIDYVRAIKADPVAVQVKLADLAHNSDLSRCAGTPLSEEVLSRLQQKYDAAKKILME